MNDAIRCGWCGYLIGRSPTVGRTSTLFQLDPHPLHLPCAREFDQASRADG